ncbi:MAG: type II toxin-antitoxin system Phd/YefM family antitoxin [Clostridiaceae bacterium]|nr:type II toxin-antitoxin system Phd/YefM family antitoxin [Clostridiaceae bacterium]
MKAGAVMDVNENLLKFTEHLVSISEFSKGKTSKIFEDVKNNNTEYIVLKNNQPTAIVISVESYRELVKKAAKMEALLEKIEEARLLKLVESRMENFDPENTISFEDFVNEQGFDMDEIISDADSVEIE